MSNIVPPLVSSTPPPITGFLDDEEDDEFGDFAAANDMNFGCDVMSLPSSPTETPEKTIFNNNSDMNSQIINTNISKNVEKDFQDKRKNVEDDVPNLNHNHVNNITYGIVTNKTNKHSTFQYFPDVPPDISCDVTPEFNNYRNCTPDTIKSQVPSEALNLNAQNYGIVSTSFTDNVKNTEFKFPDLVVDDKCSGCDMAIQQVDKNSIETNEFTSEKTIISNDINLSNNFSNEIKSSEINIKQNLDEIREVDVSEEKDSFGDFNDFPVNLDGPQHKGTISKNQIIKEKINDDFNTFSNFQDNLLRLQSETSPNVNKTLEQNELGQDTEEVRTLENDFDFQNKLESDKPQDIRLNETINQVLLDSKGNGGSDDDFSEFNDFQMNSQNEDLQVNVSQHLVQVPDELTQNILQNNDEAEDNDFGNFNDLQDDSKTVDLQLKVSQHFVQVPDEQSQNILQNDDEADADFGNFNDFQDDSQTVDLQIKVSQNFEQIPSELILNNVPNFDETDDDFGVFNDFHQETQLGDSLNENVPRGNFVEDFSDFKTKKTDLDFPSNEGEFLETNSNNLNFGDFDNQVFEKQELEIAITSVSGVQPNRKIEFDYEDDDDYGDFNDYPLEPKVKEPSSIQDFSKVDMKIALEKSEELILEMFPSIKTGVRDFNQVDFLICNPVFNSLKDVTDTSAITYQWGKSTSQKCLLQALNIDSRNIMFGARWNESIPRYAATLGFKPLEPVKSELVVSSPTETSSSITLTPETLPANEIPSAQFDWVGSGLTNPLENSTASTMLLDLEQLVASLDIQYSSNLTNKSPNSSSPINEIDEWEFWLSSVTSKVTLDKPIGSEELPHLNILPEEIQDPSSPCDLSPSVEPEILNENDSESVKSLKLNIIPSESLKGDSLTKLSSFQYSNEFDNGTSWSYNPVLLRETHITNSTLQTEPAMTDFQVPDILKPVATFSKTEVEDDDFADFQIGNCNNVHVTTSNNETKLKSDLKINDGSDDDDFTDFQSTVPTQVKEESTIAILEPTKLSILQPIVSTNAPATINWPDPGISDVDLHGFEFNYKPKLNEENEVASNRAIKSEPEKNKGADDDEWSDFVSTKVKTSPTKTTSRTATPELQLSVPHLSQIRPPKKPVPNITQHNFFQSDTTLTKKHEPLVQPSVQKFDTYPSNHIHPSLISNQYAAHFQQPFFNYSNRPMIPEASKPNNSTVQNFNQLMSFNAPYQLNSVKKVEDTDDEWSDFVSSQPELPKVFNGLTETSQPKLNYDWNKPPQFTNWSVSTAPKIITNPASFDSFQSYNQPPQTDLLKSRASTKKTPNVVIQPNNSRQIPSISSVPDLDFVGTKGKTWKK